MALPVYSSPFLTAWLFGYAFANDLMWKRRSATTTNIVCTNMCHKHILLLPFLYTFCVCVCCLLSKNYINNINEMALSELLVAAAASLNMAHSLLSGFSQTAASRLCAVVAEPASQNKFRRRFPCCVCEYSCFVPFRFEPATRNLIQCIAAVFLF